MEGKQIKQFKLLLQVIKIIPIVMAVALFVMIMLLFFRITSNLLELIFGTSLFSLTFFYLSSYVFNFCFYHRLPLYYIFITLILCLCDTYIGLPINLAWLFVIHIVLFIIMVTQLIKFYLYEHTEWIC